MSIVINKKHNATIERENLGQTKEGELKTFVDCVLVSADGMRFNIHEKIINQTQLMRNILEDAREWTDCSQTTKILLTCPGEELKKLLQFFYDGKINCENEDEASKILKSLKDLFGFSDDDLECQGTRPKSVNEDQKKSLESATVIPVTEEMDCEKTDMESPENTNMTPKVEAMDCSPIDCGDLAPKVEAGEKKGLKKSSSKGFFVPWKPPPTVQKMVTVEDKENQGNQRVMTEL